MKKFRTTVIRLLLMSAILASCDCLYDYSLTVENSTGMELKVVYEIQSKREAEEIIVVIPNGESRLITEEKEVFVGGGCPGISCQHCSYFIGYLQAYINDTMPSKIETCDCTKLSFTESGKRSGKFKIKYTIDDF